MNSSVCSPAAKVFFIASTTASASPAYRGDGKHGDPEDMLVAALSSTDPVIGSGGLYFGPVLDLKHLMRHPFYPDAPDETAQVPLIIGNTLHETAAFMRDTMVANDTTWDNLPERMAKEAAEAVDLHGFREIIGDQCTFRCCKKLGALRQSGDIEVLANR